MSYLLCTFVVCVLVWLTLRRREKDPLEQLPGPKQHPFIGHALVLAKINPDELFNTLVEYAQKFGDRFIFKLPGKIILHIHNPTDVEAVLSNSKNITKSKAAKLMEKWLGNGLLLSTGNIWHRRRKILTPAFHFKILKSFFVVIEEKSRSLVEQLKTTKGEEVDIWPFLSDFTLSTACETAMGIKLDSDKSSAILEYKAAVINIGYLFVTRISKIWLQNEIIFNSSAAGREFKKCLATIFSFGDDVIKVRKEQKRLTDNDAIGDEDQEIIGKKRLAMLDLLLEAEAKGAIDLEGIRDEVNTFIFTGLDTTATGLTFCLMLLANHDEVQERVYKETQQLFDKCGGVLSMSDFSEMKYLEAVIKESLRLYPSAPIIGREIDENFMLGDLLVKKGTEVYVHIYSLHRRQDMYPDPESFRPERFLSGEMKTHPYAYVPFSAGPRNCIGQRFAMLEMKCALSEICRHFRLEPRARGHKPRLMSDIVLRPCEPIYVKFIPRACSNQE